MTEYNVTSNKLPVESITHPAFPTDKVCRTTFINYAEPREIPDWLKRNLLDRRFKDDVKRYKYLKYAEISLDKSQNCIYSSIRLDGNYIAVGVAVPLHWDNNPVHTVYLDSSELDRHKINIFVPYALG